MSVRVAYIYSHSSSAVPLSSHVDGHVSNTTGRYVYQVIALYNLYIQHVLKKRRGKQFAENLCEFTTVRWSSKNGKIYTKD